ncbi:hypothetical protein [Gloeothece verrucosa]|uniref:Uncharacterized protein n=1 Tax=Gloeothece verrucosa (strain PCC 7822) TaxID=497965 RepID=E0UNK7_GLOV7|nr:hypothetical protein [Gloeothece verrucosa]ADN18537.1 hypothetical protein Cyan7822_6893 [Gloeothece verrucosa PCC 7822]
MNSTIPALAKAQYREISNLYQKTPLYQQLLQKYNYQKVRGYTPIKSVCLANTFLTGGSDKILPNSFYESDILHDPIWLTAVAGAFDFIKEKAPFYWVNKDLIKSLLSTELPSSVGELKIPFSRAMFVLPENLILTPDRLPLEWLYFRYLPAGFQQPSIEIIDSMGQVQSIPGTTLTVDKIVWTTSVKGLIYKGIQEITEGEITRGELTIVEYHDYLNIPRSDKETEQRFCSMIDDLIIKILLYLQIRGDKIDLSEERAYSPKNTKNIPLTPSWIGKNYQAATPSSLKISPSNHASPRPHCAKRPHEKGCCRAMQN